MQSNIIQFIKDKYNRVLLFISFGVIIFSAVQHLVFFVLPILATNKTWDFSTASDYTYDNTKLEFSAGQVQLKATANWYDVNWKYRKKITIDADKVNSTQTNFPVLVKLDATNFDFSKSRGDGFDIRFTDSDGVTLLTYERERHDAINEAAEYWVNIPSLSGSVDTDIYIYYTPDTARQENFLDTTNIESTSEVSFQINQPVKYNADPNGYIFGSASDTWDYSKAYVTVLTDASWPSESRYRMWYSGFDETNYKPCYAYSSDGISFTKPNLNQVTFSGNKNNNIFSFTNDDVYSGQITAINYDSTTGLYTALRGTKPDGIGGWPPSNEIYTSSDPTGSWTLQKALTTNLPSPAIGISHGMGLVKRNDGRWLEYYQYWGDGSYRSIGAYLSDTTSLSGSWTDLGLVQSGYTVDNQRHGVTVFREGDYFYHLTENYDDSPVIAGPLVFSVSRDGQIIKEKDTNWLPFGASETWDDALLFKGSFSKVGNEWFVYYVGAPGNSAPFWGNIGVAKMGYHRAGGITGTGSVTSTAITPSASLIINANASAGKLEVELLDASTDAVITGYSKDDFDDITTNTYSTEATWGGNSIPTDRNLKIKFYLTNATIYFWQIGNTDSAIKDLSSRLTWNNKYKSVHHLEETTLALSDSTNNLTIGTKNGANTPSSVTTGKIGKGFSFNGSAYVDFTDTTLLDGLSQITVLAWINTSSATNQIIAAKAYADTAFTLSVSSTASYKAKMAVNNGTSTLFALSNLPVNDGIWHYIVGTWDGSAIKIYIDGILQDDVVTLTGGAIPNTTDRLSFGSYLSSGLLTAGFFNGQIDEINIGNTAWSDNQIKAAFNNQNSPSTFYNIDTETSVYNANKPTVLPLTANSQIFTSLSGFSETATKNGGQIKYQVSNDSGTTWYWYNSGWTTTSSGYTETNTVAEINSNIVTLPLGSGSFLFKAYLNSDGTQLVQLDAISLTYENIAPTPTPTLTPTPTPTTVPTATPTPTPTSQTSTSDNSGGSSSGSSSGSSCTNSVTRHAPDLYEIKVSSTTAGLYFTPPTMPYSGFNVAYSQQADKWQYGASFSFGESKGAIYYVINSLTPNSKYFIRVQATNGCSTGPWGNTMIVNTTNKMNLNKTYYKNILNAIVAKIKNISLPKKINISKTLQSPNIPTSTPIILPNQPVVTPEVYHSNPDVSNTTTGTSVKNKFCIFWWCF